MTDERLRQLERRWQESGSVHDEAAYLLERVRVGDLSKERLELAAYCGHEGARGALGEDAPEVPTESLARIGTLLGSGDRQVRARASLCLGRLLTTAYPWRRQNRSEGLSPDLCETMFRQVEVWLLGRHSDEQLLRWSDDEWAVLSAEDTQGWSGDDHSTVENPYPTLDEAVEASNGVLGLPWDLLSGEPVELLQACQYEWFGAETIRKALFAELVPWALGESDPVLDRVGAGNSQ